MNKTSFEKKNDKTKDCQISIGKKLQSGKKAENILAETLEAKKKSTRCKTYKNFKSWPSKHQLYSLVM